MEILFVSFVESIYVKMWKRQRRLLDKLYRTYGKFRVAARSSYGFWNHYTYPSRESKSILRDDGMTDRAIMKDEIVIESDLTMRKMNRGVTEMLEKKLRTYNYSYDKWFSGNKSYHIQTIFPELRMIQNKEDLNILKRLFILWLYDFDERALGKHKIDLLLAGNHLIKLEFSWHHLTSERKRLRSDHETDEENRLPNSVWKKFSDIKNISRNYTYKKMSVFDMNCIRYFFRNALPDCRKRVAFILLTNFKSELSPVSANALFIDWNKNINSNYINSYTERYMINYHKGDRTPKCSYIRDVLKELDIIELCKSCKYA